MNKIAKIRNIIAKTILWIIGIALVVSVFWGHILQGFNRNNTEIKEWTINDLKLLGISFVLMLGATYYNRIIDSIIAWFERLIKK